MQRSLVYFIFWEFFANTHTHNFIGIRIYLLESVCVRIVTTKAAQNSSDSRKSRKQTATNDQPKKVKNTHSRIKIKQCHGPGMFSANVLAHFIFRLLNAQHIFRTHTHKLRSLPIYRGIVLPACFCV